MDILALLLAIGFATLRLATPLIFASMGGLLSERSGVINIALEGFMLAGAFSAAVFAHMGASSWLGWLTAFFVGLLAGALYAFLTIELKADQIVAGTAFNLLIMGAAPFLGKIIFNSTGSTPSLLAEDRFDFEPTLMAFVLVGLITWWLSHTRSGLWVTFAGESPEALSASGISLRKVRWTFVALSGALAGLGGASLSLFLASSYSPMMTGGRGFIALAALIFGKWRPLPTLVACLFFGLTDAIQIRLQGVQLAGVEIPVQFIQILPYLVTIVTLAGFMGRGQAPKALGQ